MHRVPVYGFAAREPIAQGLLTSERIKQALLTVRQEKFIPEEYRDHAYRKVPLPLPGEAATISCPHSYPLLPEVIVNTALSTGCESISYIFTEPTIFYELAYDTAVLAHERGLKNTFVSNGFDQRDAATRAGGSAGRCQH